MNNWSRFDFDKLPHDDLQYIWDYLGSQKLTRKTRAWSYYTNRDLWRFYIYSNQKALDIFLKYRDHPSYVDGHSNQSGTSSSLACNRYTHWCYATFDNMKPLIEESRSLSPYVYEWGNKGYVYYFNAKNKDALTFIEDSDMNNGIIPLDRNYNYEGYIDFIRNL